MKKNKRKWGPIGKLYTPPMGKPYVPEIGPLTPAPIKMGVPANKVPVSTRALVQRINRKLQKDDEKLKACRRDSRAYHDLGDFYVVDVSTGFVTTKDIDLEGIGREMGVLKPYEHLTEVRCS